MEYLQLWDLVGVVLHPEIVDVHSWVHTSSGQYSTKSAYNQFFLGSITFEPWKCLWKAWAPLRCKFFLWLAVLNRCWTADQLARRHLLHPATCPLCDQAEETIQHLLIDCVFSLRVVCGA